jgi:hypothetical protein
MWKRFIYLLILSILVLSFSLVFSAALVLPSIHIFTDLGIVRSSRNVLLKYTEWMSSAFELCMLCSPAQQSLYTTWLFRSVCISCDALSHTIIFKSDCTPLQCFYKGCTQSNQQLALSPLMHSIHWIALYFHTKCLEKLAQETLIDCTGLHYIKFKSVEHSLFAAVFTLPNILLLCPCIVILFEIMSKSVRYCTHSLQITMWYCICYFKKC